MEENTESEFPPSHPAAPAGCRFRPWLFFGLLILPGIASILMTRDSSNYYENSLNVLIFGSIAAGIFCGIHFAMIQRLSLPLKIIVGIVSVIGCGGVAFALGMGGCSLMFWLTETF